MKRVVIYTDGSCKDNGLWYAVGGWAAVLQAYIDKDEWECYGCGYKGKLETFDDTECDGDVWGTCPECKKNNMIQQTTNPNEPAFTSKFSGGLTFGTDKTPVTSVRAEMYGIWKALTKIMKKCDLTVSSDSEICIKCLNGQYGKKKNADLWERIDREIRRLELLRCKLEFIWIKGHNGNVHNEAMDIAAKKRTAQVEDTAVGICMKCKKKRKTCGFCPGDSRTCYEGYEPRNSVIKEFKVCKECLNDRMVCGYEPDSQRYCDGMGTIISWDNVDEVE